VINNYSVGFDRRAVQRVSVAIEALLYTEEPQAPDAGPCASAFLSGANDDQDKTSPAA
jgi:hypothetical protein